MHKSCRVSALLTTCVSRTDGTVDLWLEDDFNAASRMPAGRPYGRRENVAWSGREKPDAGVAVHTVYIKCVPVDGRRHAAGLACLTHGDWAVSCVTGRAKRTAAR